MISERLLMHSRPLESDKLAFCHVNDSLTVQSGYTKTPLKVICRFGVLVCFSIIGLNLKGGQWSKLAP